MKDLTQRVLIAGWARRVLEQDFLIVDLETTGFNPTTSHIVQVGIINQAAETLLNQYVNPGVPMPQTATDVNGITDEDVADAPSWGQVLPDVEALLCGGISVGAYNVQFDKGQLAANGVRVAAVGWLPCIMQQYARFWGDWRPRYGSFRWQKLTAACKQQGVIVHNAHDSIADCQMTLQLLHAMASAALRDNKEF